VRDTVAMLAALAETPAAYGSVVNVGDAQEVTIRALAESIRARAGSASPIQYLSYAEAYGKNFEQIPQRRPGLDRLHALISVRPRWNLEMTIDDLVAYYREQTSGKAQTAARVTA
jgi:UDP-glucose 4-epimerase